MSRITWNQYYMAQCHLLALRSTCTRLMVGTTIVRDKRIIAGGYNGSITGGEHCIDDGCYVENNHCIRTIHAEINALLQCAKFGVPTTGAEIYVTHFPCLNCTKSIIQSGIKKVYYDKDYKNHPYALQLFKDANVDVEQVELEEMILETKTIEKIAFTASLIAKLEASGVSDAEIKKLTEEANILYTSTS